MWILAARDTCEGYVALLWTDDTAWLDHAMADAWIWTIPPPALFAANVTPPRIPHATFRSIWFCLDLHLAVL